MPTTRYVTLAASDNSLVKRFKAVQYKPLLKNTDDIKETASGSLDKSAGSRRWVYQFTFRVIKNETDPLYGDLDDLEAFFLMNNPQGTPNDKITYTDFFGNSHTCFILGDMGPEAVTTMLEGVNAIHFVNVILAKVQPE